VLNHILPHGDADHAKEVPNIHKEIKIESIKINDGKINNYEQKALDLIGSKEYKEKNLNLKFLNYKLYNDENSNSLLTLIKIYDTKIISFGDAPQKVEDDVTLKYNLKDINILKLSHHGSKTSSSEFFLDRLNPDIAIISSGRNNRFHHPNKETINNLKKLQIDYLNTQTSGTIEFVINKNNVTYNEYRP